MYNHNCTQICTNGMHVSWLVVLGNKPFCLSGLEEDVFKVEIMNILKLPIEDVPYVTVYYYMYCTCMCTVIILYYILCVKTSKIIAHIYSTQTS